jgi:hypothetical protein
LFTNGAWRVEGVEDAAVPAGTFGSIAISDNLTNLGHFAQLKVYFTTTNGTSHVCTIGGNGLIRPILLDGVPGAEAYLSSYWDCETAGYVDMGITHLTIDTKKKGKNIQLRMRGLLSNFNSMGGRKLELLFMEPEKDLTSVSVDYTLFATRDLCIDEDKQDTGEGFPAARIAGTYFDADNHDCNIARVSGITDVTCYPYAGCIRRTKDFCRDLSNPQGLMFTNKAYRLAHENLMLLHTDDQPSAYPTLRIRFRKPSPGQLRGQGYAGSAVDASDRNVVFWGNWYRAKKAYKERRRIYRFRYTVEALPFGTRSCEGWGG